MSRNKIFKRNLVVSLILLFIIGCSTYYESTQDFQNYLMNGNFQQANQWLKNDKKGREGKNKLLHYLNRGYVAWMLDSTQKSNEYFHEADRIIEDYLKNYSLEALALVSNPNVKPYSPEDFEAVMLYYYTALNYIKMGNYEDALVECRRINIRLQELNDKYKDHKNKYQRDAFAHYLMGMIYETNANFNDAFIAYRNAYEAYKEDYTEYFNMTVPDQLKHDLLRAAYLTGFSEEVAYYEKEFGIDYEYQPKENGELIVLWLNGFGPIKDENVIQFSKGMSGENGYITLSSGDEGMNFPVYMGDKSAKEKTALSNLSFFKIALPKYVERKPVYKRGKIYRNGEKMKMEMAQDVNEIAFKTLRDRLIRELSNAILRVAIKKALEELIKEQDETLGMIANWVNTATEKADTRNWQTLPYSINVSRIPLEKGKNTVKLKTYRKNGTEKTLQFFVDGKKNKTIFKPIHTYQCYLPGQASLVSSQ